ncbi:MAG: TIM barrel protein [Firmicutes bacterium]|nr:TIM barrel protein [Bacillota bacterium]
MIRFGPSGNSKSFYESGRKYTYQEGEFLNSLGLNAFEYSFGRGAYMSSETAEQIKNEFDKYNIKVSCHAPYFINFASDDQEKIAKSFGYIVSSINAIRKMGGQRVVFHAGSQSKLERVEAFGLTYRNVVALDNLLDQSGVKDITLCPETMGKDVQIGSVEEVIELCKISSRFVPCFDFGHINCIMRGRLDSTSKFVEIFEYGIKHLGRQKIDNCHIHFSKIEYGSKGEIRHTTFDDPQFGPNPRHLIEAIKQLDLHPTIICESKDQMSDDALVLKNLYDNKNF